MTTTPAREAIRRAAAENGWHAVTYSEGRDMYAPDGVDNARVLIVYFNQAGSVNAAFLSNYGSEDESVTWEAKGKREAVLSWLTQYGDKAQPTPAQPKPSMPPRDPAWRHMHRPVDLCGHRPDEFCDRCCDCKVPGATEPGAHQRALADAELVNWISTRMTELRLDSRNHREQLAALATTETIARLSRHLRGAMVAEVQLHVFQDALTAAVHRPVDRPLADVVAEALESYLTFQTPSTERERARLNARMLAAKEIGAHLDGIR